MYSYREILYIHTLPFVVIAQSCVYVQVVGQDASPPANKRYRLYPSRPTLPFKTTWTMGCMGIAQLHPPFAHLIESQLIIQHTSLLALIASTCTKLPRGQKGIKRPPD